VAALKPDLVLTINRAGLCPEVLELKGPRVASWFIDNINILQSEMHQFGETEQVFLFGPRSVSEEQGAPSSLPMNRRHYLPLAVDAHVFRPHPRVEGLDTSRLNILFIGGFFASGTLWGLADSKSPEFYKLLRHLYQLGGFSSVRQYQETLAALGLTEGTDEDRQKLFKGLLWSWTGEKRRRMLEAVQHLGLTIYGGGWTLMIPEHFELLTCYAGCSINDSVLLSKLFSHAKLTVNVTHAQSQLCGGLNLRTFEAMSTGTLLLNDNVEDMSRMFEEGVEFLGYRTEEELRERCEWALANPEASRKIAEAGRRAVMSEHTLQHRIVALLRVMEAC